MTYYLREQSIGEMIWNSFSIYVRYFPIFFTYFLLLLPVYIFIKILLNEDVVLMLLLSLSIYLAIALLFEAIFTIFVSDIYLGSKPDILRSCKHVLKPMIMIKLLNAMLLTFIMGVTIIFIIFMPRVIFPLLVGTSSGLADIIPMPTIEESMFLFIILSFFIRVVSR